MQDTLTADDRPNEGPAPKADSVSKRWSVTRQSSLRTTYRYHKRLDGVQVSIHVSTPQDGTWLLDATIEVDPRGRAFLPTLSRGYESRPEAEFAAVRLITGLNSDVMVRQFIIGQSNPFRERELSTVTTIRQALEADLQ
ncbi:hypothetical protein [Halorubrum sp. AJ67]|uniref:hypothetical protein n=1 Tax=Halorubrum sp. AJ67 TaxID=1173487 RepID=UPI0003DD25B3|nr:hypothetical protein [Halorubrum sp. AJ67]CDK38170.1 hypothetical protein BN903_370 [Halorubrum sp. AJ67]